jgi:hypothetical protein
VTLQFFDDEGQRSEAVGKLERVEMRDGEPFLHIRKKDDSTVVVALGRIRAGHVVNAPTR